MTKFLVCNLVAIAACASLHGGPVTNLATVEGHLGQNLDTTVVGGGLTVYDTGAQTGSPVSTLLPWSASCSTCSGYTITGSGDANVTNGSLHADSTVTVSGTVGAHFLSSADSNADYFDTLMITGGSGSGVLALQYLLDGSITQTGTGPNVTSFLAFADTQASSYKLGNGAITSGNEADFFGNGAVNTTVTFYIQFTYGSAAFTDLNLDAFAAFASGDSSGFTSNVNFLNTASLNSAIVFNGTLASLGAQNNSAVITSGSGINFQSSAVPEPATWFLVVSAIGLLAFVKRRSAETVCAVASDQTIEART